VLTENLSRDVRRLDLRRIEVRTRDELHQVGVSRLVHGEQCDVPVADRAYRGRAALARVLAAILEVDGQRHADDRLDAGVGQFVGEFQSAVEVIRVGQPHCREAERVGKLGELTDGQRTFQQRVGGVHLEMHEARFRGLGRLSVLWQTSRSVHAP
jgi:hypothetical protein